ncbi:MAG TPA: argininosuccinate lyase [Vicinamibacteria bacterium]|nr:argininosuccinate lyase [Vicinamibacteria bacterium]
MKKLWGGRFRKPTAPALEALSRSIEFDRRLWREDVLINRAYARELAEVGILSPRELEQSLSALDAVEAKLRENPPLDDEDIHTAVERLLAEELVDAEVASKLPTGRSRNDLAATGFRMHLAASIAGLLDGVQKVQAVLLEKAKASTRVILPGYTHMRRGQPVVFAQYLLAWFWALERDRERLEAARARALELPLGAGALAGNPFGVDRARLARELGFASVLPNSIDAVSSRDFALEFLSAAAILGVNLSRMAEDLILWSGAEFSFVSFDESYATGSSLMPQKQNPDGLELIRGKTGRLAGNLVSLLTTTKGLATGYQRDLQEDKEPVFDALDTLNLALPVMQGVLGTLVANEERMTKALSFELLATDLAEYLVRKGVSFRKAHEIVGQVLARAEERAVAPAELPLSELRALSPEFDSDVSTAFDFRASVERRDSEGGVSARAIDAQIRKAEKALAR